MKVKTDENKIVMSDLPLERWLFGLVFSIAGLNVVLPSLFEGNWFGALFGSVFVVAGYVGGLSAPYQRILIDRWQKNITIRKIGLLVFQKTEYRSDEIEKIYSEAHTDSDNDKSYTICCTLKSGQSMVLGTPFGSKAECETIIKTAETFLKQMSFPERYQPEYL